MTIFEICSKIATETTKYTRHSHELFHIHEREIHDVTQNLVPEKFSTSQRISYIIELESDPSMKTRYFMECPCCKQRFHRTKGLNSVICTPCRKTGYNICDKHNEIYLRSCLKCLIEESHEKYTEENKSVWLECQICGFRGGDLNAHIIKIHNMETDDYRKRFNIRSIKCQALCDVILGEANPAYQHGGKFSPFSQKYIHADKTDIEKVKAKAAKTRADNGGNSTTIEYWLKKTAGDQIEAQKLLSQRQSTFTLEKCINKYGEELGLERWIKRQEKWLDTLSKKSSEELEEINKKKSTKINYQTLWRNDIIANGILYLIKLPNNLFKIGVTTKNISSRYKLSDLHQCQILIEFNSTINHCFQVEQLIKQKFKSNIILKTEMYKNFGWTETFKNIDELILISEITNLTVSENYTLKLFKETFNLNYAENF